MKKIPVLKYPVTVTAARVCVPVYMYDLSEAEQIFVIINYLQHKKLTPLTTTAGYRSYLRETNDEKLLASWKMKLKDRYNLNLSWEYINLAELNEFTNKRKDNNVWGNMWPVIDFQTNFERYLKMNVTVYSDSYYTEKDLQKWVDNYVRYLPYLQDKFKVYGDYLNGYCCEDHDGSTTDYIRSGVESEISRLVRTVPNFINVKYPELKVTA